MDFDFINQEVNKYNYLEPQVLSVDCDHFCEEILITIDDRTEMKSKGVILFQFLGCHSFNYCFHYKEQKPVKELNYKQMAFFLQGITIEKLGVKAELEENLYEFHALMLPAEVKIIFENLEIYHKPFSEITDERWSYWKNS